MRSTSSLKYILIFILSVCALFLYTDTVNAVEGVAVTGSLTTYEYTIVQGETLKSPLVNIIFFNDYTKDVTLQLYLDAPEGFTIPLEEEIITLEANSRLDIPIAITVDSTVPVGEYEIAIKATLIDNAIDGQVNVGADYVLKSKVNVVNQSSQVNISIADITGETITSDINLYRISDNIKSPAAYSDTGEISSVLAPGQYEITAYYNNYQIAQQQFVLEEGTNLEQTLTADTLLIYNYKISPIFDEENSKQLNSININYTLENIYKDIQNARIAITVYKDNMLIEEQDISYFDVFPVGIQELNDQYLFSDKYDYGGYKFIIKVYSDTVDASGNIINSVLYSQSLPAILNYSKTTKSITEMIDIRIILFAGLIGIAIGLYLLFRYISKKINPEIEDEITSPAPEILEQKAITAPEANDAPQETDIPKEMEELQQIAPEQVSKCPLCDGEGQMECPECGGSGKIKYGTIEEECIYCSGLGVVLCASCVERKHLRVCPRCNGDGYTHNDDQRIDCTFCNSLGYVMTHKNAKYINDVKMKLGTKKENKDDK